MNRLSPRREFGFPTNLWTDFIRSPLSVSRLVGHRPHLASLQSFYWWNVIWTALIVSLGQVFSIPFPDRAFLHAFYAVLLVLFGGAVLLYPGMMVMDWLSRQAAIRGHDLTRRAVLMAISPWFIVIAATMVVSPLFLIPAVPLALTVYVLVEGLAKSQAIAWREAAVLVLGFASFVLVVLFCLFWIFGWDVYAI